MSHSWSETVREPAAAVPSEWVRAQSKGLIDKADRVLRAIAERVGYVDESRFADLPIILQAPRALARMAKRARLGARGD